MCGERKHVTACITTNAVVGTSTTSSHLMVVPPHEAESIAICISEVRKWNFGIEEQSEVT